ncbi:hypothetical protein ACWIUH_12290 [Ursidibacter arcticus]
MRIKVLVDIYKNYFPKDEYPTAYVYDNVRAIDVSQQNIVDLYVAEMAEQEFSIILDRNMYLPKNELKPIESDREAILNIESKKFEF